MNGWENKESKKEQVPFGSSRLPVFHAAPYERSLIGTHSAKEKCALQSLGLSNSEQHIKG